MIYDYDSCERHIDIYHIFATEIKIASIHPTVRLDVPGAILGAVCALHGRSTPQEHAAPNQPISIISIDLCPTVLRSKTPQHSSSGAFRRDRVGRRRVSPNLKFGVLYLLILLCASGVRGGLDASWRAYCSRIHRIDIPLNVPHL